MDYPPIGNRQDGISSNRQPVSGRVSGSGEFTVYIFQLAWTNSVAETGERSSVVLHKSTGAGAETGQRQEE